MSRPYPDGGAVEAGEDRHDREDLSLGVFTIVGMTLAFGGRAPFSESEHRMMTCCPNMGSYANARSAPPHACCSVPSDIMLAGDPGKLGSYHR